MNPRKFNESGQALLLVLLSMAVILTIVLSILARSITDVSTSKQDEESLRAFSAAEAGVEKALIIGSISDEDFGTNASYTANVDEYGEGLKEFVNPISNLSGESTTLWFVPHKDGKIVSCKDNNKNDICFAGNQINVCWGSSDEESVSQSTPAVEITVVYASTPEDYSTVKIARVTADPNASRRSDNGFDAPDAGSCSVSDTNFLYQKMVTFENLGIPSSSYNAKNGLLYAKVKFFYNTDYPSKVGFNANLAGNGDLAIFPSQGTRIESSGASGNANRRLEVFETFAQAPEVFDSSLFTLGGIIK